MQIEAVLLDKDGVVLDSEAPKRTTYRALIQRMYGIDLAPTDFAWALGLSFEATAGVLAERFRELPIIDKELLPPPSVDLGVHIIRTRQRLDREQHPDFPPLMSGVPELIEDLTACSVPRGLATSDYFDVVSAMLEAKQIGTWFETVVTRDVPRVLPPKPEPDIFLVAAERLAVPISRTVVVDDSAPGVLAAHRAGARAVIYLADPRVGPPDPATQNLATATVPNIREAHQVIRQLRAPRS